MRYAAALSLLGTVYVLSVGPAAVFEREPFFGVVYAPLILLHDNTPLQGPLDRYVDFCKLSAPPHRDDVPAEAMIAGKKVCFDEASLCRGFVEWPPGGSPMFVSFRICTADRSALPAGIRMEKAWVIHKGSAWVSRLEEPRKVTPRDGAPCVVVHAEGGPRWEPGIRADVLIELRDEEDNAYMLLLRNREVRRVE